MSGAGDSAQAKYDRLAARHRSQRTGRLVWNLGVAAVIAVVGWTYGRDLYPSLIWWFIGFVFFIGFMKAVVQPNHVRAWGIGAEGERVTDRELEKLPQGHRVLHDRRIPGTRRNIDHIVIGPAVSSSSRPSACRASFASAAMRSSSLVDGGRWSAKCSTRSLP